MKNVKPNFGFPGGSLVQLGLAWFLAAIVVAMIVMFFVSLVSAVRSLTGKREGGPGKAIAGVALSLIVGALATIGTSVFFNWAAFFKIK